MKKLLFCISIFLFLYSSAYADVWFVSKTGSDSNNGKSWAAAFSTEARIDGHGSGDSATAGDTVVFGTGFWYDAYIVTLSDTWYVCSSYYNYMTGVGSFAQAISSSRLSTGRWRTVLYSGKELTSITKVGLDAGGNDSIWKAPWSATEGMVNSWPTVARIVSQGGQPDYAESLLCRQTSLANLDLPGEWYIATSPTPDTIYFIPYGDVTGTSVNMIASCNAVFHFEPPGADINQIHIWGIECKGGQQGTILVEPNGGDVESCYVEYCHLAFSAQDHNENAAVVMFRRETPYRTRFFYLRNDSIGWALSDPTDNSGTPPWQGNTTTSDGSKSAGVRTYNSENLYVDSCTFYGFYSAGVHLKNDPYDESHTVPFFGNNVRFSHIYNTGGIGIYIGEYPYKDSIIGNVIEGMERAIFQWESSGVADIDSLWNKFGIFIGNNTFYDISENIVNFAYSGGEPCGDSNKYIGNIAYNCSLGAGDEYFRLCDEGSTCSATGVTDTWRTVDENMWYGGSTFEACIDGADRNWTYWTSSQGWDANGTNTTNPNFSDPTGSGNMWNRFFRPSASAEMNLTYSGKTWTIAGAVQESHKYFVTKNGSDSNNGKSWATAWLTASKVQSTIVVGDTIIWGSGTWEEARIKPPAGGDNSNWTRYICSTYYTGTTASEKLAGKGLTTWSGGKAVTGWHDTTISSTTVKVAYYSPSVVCKNDGAGGGRPGAMSAMRRQGHDSMYVPIQQGSISTFLSTAGPGHAYSGGDDERNAILIKDYTGWSTLGANDTVWCGCDSPLAFDNDNTSHIQVWGINLYEGHGALTYRANNVDSTWVEHARIRYGGRDVAGDNPAAIFSDGEVTGSDHNHIVSCNIGWGCGVPNEWPGALGTAPWDGITGHGAVVMIYSQNHMVFDSCIIDKGFGAHGFFFKQTKPDTDPWEGSTVKNCYVDGTYLDGGNVTDPCGAFFYDRIGVDSAYGNVFANLPFGIMRWMDGTPTASMTWGDRFFNNTFYNCERAGIAFKQNGGTTPGGTMNEQIRYNVFQKAGSYSEGAVAFFTLTGAEQDTVRADSNMYWMTSGTLGFRCSSANDNTFAQWKAGNCSGIARDALGQNVNPNLSNPASGNFARPSASGEMNRTYGGQTWSIFGAIQPSGDSNPPAKIQDLMRSDILNRNKSGSIVRRAYLEGKEIPIYEKNYSTNLLGADLSGYDEFQWAVGNLWIGNPGENGLTPR